MNRVYMHSKINKNSLIKILLTIFSFFFVYGLYKNGIKLYNNKLINYYEIFNILYFLIISILVTFICCKIFKEEFISYRLLYNVIICLITFATTNPFIYLALIFALNILYKYIKIPIVPIYMIIYSILNMILNNYSYLNMFEKNVISNYSFFDYLIGRGIGGIGNTFLIVSIIGLIVLIFNKEYKRNIPVIGLVTYYVFIIIYSFIIRNIDVNLMINNNLIFSMIFILPISIDSPYSKGGCYLFGIISGILMFGFSFIDINFGIYITLIVMYYMHPLLDNFIVGKNSLLVDSIK